MSDTPNLSGEDPSGLCSLQPRMSEMPLSCLWHPEHCSCAGIPPSWKLPILQGAAADINLTGLEGLVPECPSAVQGLPRACCREGRGLWPSPGPRGSCGGSASSSRTWVSLLLHKHTRSRWERGVEVEGKIELGRKAGPRSFRSRSFGGTVPH